MNRKAVCLKGKTEHAELVKILNALDVTRDCRCEFFDHFHQGIDFPLREVFLKSFEGWKTRGSSSVFSVFLIYNNGR